MTEIIKLYTINITWKKLTIYHSLPNSTRLGMTTEFKPKAGMLIDDRKALIKDRLKSEGLTYND
tara:strand:+ start:778 stop:969 length:192 start_codon:yes stop_codon:yes gene_type:complete